MMYAPCVRHLQMRSGSSNRLRVLPAAGFWPSEWGDKQLAPYLKLRYRESGSFLSIGFIF